MKIDASDISMSSTRTYLEKDELRESMRIWVGSPQTSGRSRSDQVSISPEAGKLSQCDSACFEEEELEKGVSGKLAVKKLIAELLSGKEIVPVHIEKASEGDQKEIVSQETRQGWGLAYDREEIHQEKESVTFEAKGTIKTSDGHEMSFSLSLRMNREYLEANSVSIRAGEAAIDPLIINFDGKAADLSDEKFSFDLDSDGTDEQISMPGIGSGFLAIDLNEDGVLNNGSELFGPSTGNGFAELARYDSDSNRWIDENDAVYDRLKVISFSNQGAISLSSLKDTGVGAICLDKAATPFDVCTTSGNELLGRVRATGIYLRENGAPGNIQQLDLVA